MVYEVIALKTCDMNMNEIYPVFVVGHIRSGTTIFHKLLREACPGAVDLTDDDFECRTFWQAFGLKIGSAKTGTFCLSVGQDDVTDEHRMKIGAHIKTRCREGRMLINKNPHLMNKIGFVAEVLPTSRFVFIIREIMSTVSSTKLLFERIGISNEDYPPFIHYWPDCKLPCWYTVRNDCMRPQLTFSTMRRTAKKCANALGLKTIKAANSPSRVFKHKILSNFRHDHPDASRYYPGEGFTRIPEAWITQNINALEQLRTLDENRWMLVTYKDMVSDTRETIGRVLEFIKTNKPKLSDIPQQLDFERSEKWKKDLSQEEKESIKALTKQRSLEFNRICKHFRREFIAFNEIDRNSN